VQLRRVGCKCLSAEAFDAFANEENMRHFPCRYYGCLGFQGRRAARARAIESNNGEGLCITLFDLLQDVHNYVTAHPALITRGCNDDLDKGDTYLSFFDLTVAPPRTDGNMGPMDERVITMAIDEANRCCRQFLKLVPLWPLRPTLSSVPHNLFRLDDRIVLRRL
jgi:hypothetical protein